MADLEAVLADVSYLMAMEKSKMTPAARASKKIVLPDARYVTQCTSFCYNVTMILFILWMYWAYFFLWFSADCGN